MNVKLSVQKSRVRSKAVQTETNHLSSPLDHIEISLNKRVDRRQDYLENLIMFSRTL